MICRQCGKEVEANSAFCRFCGAAVTPAPPFTPPPRLTRIPADGTVAGVCAGMANYLNADVTLVRLAWVVLSIFPGAVIGGIIAYIVAWVLMPEAPIGARMVVTHRPLLRSTSDRKIAGVCGGLAAYLSLDPTLVRLAVVILSIYPGAIICGVIAYLIAWAIVPESPRVPVGAAPQAGW